MHGASSDSQSERAAPSASGGGVVGSAGRCSVCGGAMPGRRTSACSDKFRAAKRRWKRGDDLALVEESLTRAVTRVRALRGTPAGA